MKNYLTFKVMLAGLLVVFNLGGAAAQALKVTGTVTDEAGQPMVGVGVIDKNNTRNGVVTDVDGRYRITIAKDGFLEFSSIGYKTVLEQVDSRKVIDIRMVPSTTSLDEVVVIGYGTQKKSDLTGSVAVVEMSDVHESASTNVAQALQGRVAGAEFSSQTGAPGEAGTIQIRGSRSISAGNEPLIIVDGVIDAVEDMNDINPADIVSISVLKDVSSTAIYGSRGANGVILISTDQTRQKNVGKFNVTFEAKAGFSKIAGKLDLMDASEVARWRNMVYFARYDYAEDRKDPPYPDPMAYGKGTDWQDVLSRTGTYQNYYVRLNGSNGGIRYSASFGYNDEKGVVIGSGSSRLSGVFWLNAQATKRLNFGFRASITDVKIDQTNAAVSGTNSNAAIYLSPLLTKEDTWNPYGEDEDRGGSVFNNPYICATEMTKWSRRSLITLTPSLKYDFGPYLNFKTQVTYTRSHHQNFNYQPSTLPLAQYNKTGGYAYRSNYLRQNILNENTLNYKRKILEHELQGLLGLTYERQTIGQEAVSGSGYLNDDVQAWNMKGLHDPSNYNVSGYSQIYTKLSAFARANYTYRKRYHFSLTLRADGASNFAENNKWGFFPAAAFRWSIVNEDWFARTYWLNDLSIRLSAGRSGNDAIAPYMSLATINPGIGSWQYGDHKYLIYYPAKLANSNLTWETTDAYNLGLNFEAFEGRLSIEADAYLSYTRNLLLSMKNSQVSGYDTYFNNVGSTRNAGIEVTIESINVNTNNFSWNSALTLSHNNQLVLDIGTHDVVPTYMNPRLNTQYLYGYKAGYPVNSLWGYQFCGVWKDEAEIERNRSTKTYVSGYMSNTTSATLGRSKFLDVNHDGLLDNADVVYLGNSDAVLHGGFQNNFTICKRLNIGIYFAYSLGGKIYNLSELWLATGTQGHNKYRYMLDAWSPSNPDSDIPEAYTDDTYGCGRFIHDASYLRLKTISISYDFKIGRKLHKYIKGITLGATAENVFLWKNYNGYDPDVNTSGAVFRLDNGSYPRPRTFVAKLNLKF